MITALPSADRAVDDQPSRRSALQAGAHTWACPHVNVIFRNRISWLDTTRGSAAAAPRHRDKVARAKPLFVKIMSLTNGADAARGRAVARIFEISQPHTRTVHQNF